MTPARYQVRPAGSTRVLADSEDEKRAKEYAERWCRATKSEVHVIDTRAPTLSYMDGPQYTEATIYTAKPPSEHGIPLPRPYNLPEIA